MNLEWNLFKIGCTCHLLNSIFSWSKFKLHLTFVTINHIILNATGDVIQDLFYVTNKFLLLSRCLYTSVKNKYGIFVVDKDTSHYLGNEQLNPEFLRFISRVRYLYSIYIHYLVVD